MSDDLSDGFFEEAQRPLVRNWNAALELTS
jgi:hypothetical protein